MKRRKEEQKQKHLQSIKENCSFLVGLLVPYIVICRVKTVWSQVSKFILSSPQRYTELHRLAPICTENHCNTLHHNTQDCNALRFSLLHCTEIHRTVIRCTLMHKSIFFLDKSRKLFKFVSVLLSASVKRVGVSRMRDFVKGRTVTIHLISSYVYGICQC